MAGPCNGIAGKNVLLRALTRADLETLRSFVNDPGVMVFSNTFQPVGDMQQEQWFERMTGSPASTWFGIVDLRAEEPRLVGTCCLVEIDWVGRQAELRIRIGDRGAWGHGLGSEASRMLIDYGFSDLNLTRISLRVLAFNERAICMYQKLGFQVEGRLRRAAYVKGRAEDMILMGLLREEWTPGTWLGSESA